MTGLPRRLGGRLTRGDEANADARFVEGIALGALVGAAIAGSTLWTRWRDRSRISGSGGPSDPEPLGASATIAADAHPRSRT